MINHLSKWFLRVCLILSGTILLGGMLAKDAKAFLWYNVSSGDPFPLDNTTRDCFSLPDGYVQQNCAGTKLWDYVLPHNGCSSNPNTSNCLATFGTVNSYAAAISPSVSSLVTSRLYAYSYDGNFAGADASCNHSGTSVSLCTHSLSVHLGASLIMEWEVPQNGKVTIVSYN